MRAPKGSLPPIKGSVRVLDVLGVQRLRQGLV